MKFLITHINYAGMNAREMIYKSLSSKSIEALHNGPSCSTNKRASKWTWRRRGDASLSKDAQTLFPCAPNLHPWWDFYLQARGRCLRRIWTDPAITTTSLSSTAINLLPVALFTHTTAQQAWVICCLAAFFGPLPAHFEVCSAVSPVWVAGMSRRHDVAKFMSFLKCFKVQSVGIGGSTFQTSDKDCAFIHKPSLATDQFRYLKRQFTQKLCFNHLPSTTLEASPDPRGFLIHVASWST